MGTAILRRYVLIGAVGQGGVSTVYSAVDARRGRILAVKVLAPTLADDPHARDDVRREALITDRLRHPSVPRVFEYGDAPLPDGTVVPYVVLELLTGVSLATRLATGALPWPEAVRIAATAADVLAVAHRRGVVHRDLTARNIMMTSDGIKLIDFGLATAARSAGDTGARPIVLSGSGGRPRLPAHPKTTFARPADDVYTLGVLLYEMVTGRSPYPRTTAATIVAAGRVAHLAPTPVLAVPGLPPEIGHIVRACMAKVPEARPRSAEAALALWEVLDRSGLRQPTRHAGI
jgi:serine/threonine-protein kinase